MPKPEIEFTDSDTAFAWRPVENSIPGIMEKILSHDPQTGDHTRLLKFPPGTETTETLIHDFWEEVWILEGSLHDNAKKETYLPGYYACRPPGMIHGPYKVPYGCLMFEIRYRDV
jgi:hypothetical protein